MDCSNVDIHSALPAGTTSPRKMHSPLDYQSDSIPQSPQRDCGTRVSTRQSWYRNHANGGYHRIEWCALPLVHVGRGRETLVILENDITHILYPVGTVASYDRGVETLYLWYSTSMSSRSGSRLRSWSPLGLLLE